MARSQKNRKKDSKFNSFVAIPRKILWSQEWKELSPSAKLFYIQLKAKYNGNNNGEIRLHYSELDGIKGISSSSAIANAIRELEQKEWIRKTRQGGLYRYHNKFELTGKYDDHIRP